MLLLGRLNQLGGLFYCTLILTIFCPGILGTKQCVRPREPYLILLCSGSNIFLSVSATKTNLIPKSRDRNLFAKCLKSRPLFCSLWPLLDGSVRQDHNNRNEHRHFKQKPLVLKDGEIRKSESASISPSSYALQRKNISKYCLWVHGNT